MTREEAIAVLEKVASIIDDDSIEMTIREWDEFDDLKRDAITVAIEALSAPTGGDLISRQSAIDALWTLDIRIRPTTIDAIDDMLKRLPSARPQGEWLEATSEDPCYWICSECKRQVDREENYCPECGAKMNGSTRPQGEWIPIKYHEITKKEREENGYPKDWVYYLDCEMPSDEQEILVQTRSGLIRWDVCYEDGEFSLDSGWDWLTDIIAWRPMPEPYKGGDDNEID